MIKINEEMKKKQKMNKARGSQKSNKRTMPEGGETKDKRLTKSEI
jgi:hypothetical protein